jgi:protein pelota
MKILEFDSKRGTAKLLVENLDDLWHLYNVISEGDQVYAKTSREIGGKNEAARPSRGRRVGLTLGVKVKNVDFDRSLNRLRILGVIFEAPEKYDGLLGSHHTITVSPNSILRIVKEKWHNYQVERLRKAAEIEEKPVIVVSLDDEEACIALVGRFKVKPLVELRARLPGKLEASKRGEALKKYFSEIAEALKRIIKEVKGPIAIVGPGFLKEKIKTYLSNEVKGLPRVSVFNASSGGLSGVNEAVRSGVLLRFFRKSRLLEEAKLVEDFLAKLALDEGMVAYGFEDLEKAARIGAVEKLLVVDRLLRELNLEDRVKVEELMRLVEAKGGKIFVLSGEHEGGEKILALGGLAGFLRFKLNY